MHTGSTMGTAQVIPFPARGRFAQRGGEASLASVSAAAMIYDAAFASSWYHEEALNDQHLGPKS